MAPNWSQYSVLLPQPSFSKTGSQIEVLTSSRPMVRSILRSQTYERTVSVEDQDRKWASMARAKYHVEKDPVIGAWEARRQSYRAEVRKTLDRNPNLPFAKRPPMLEPPPPPPPKPVPVPHPKSRLPDLERRLARERRRNGEKPANHPSMANIDRYSETPVHRRAASRKVFNDIPADVSRERSIITKGRRFTWGGRQKLELPGFNPHRERQLREKVSRF